MKNSCDVQNKTFWFDQLLLNLVDGKFQHAGFTIQLRQACNLIMFFKMSIYIVHFSIFLISSSKITCSSTAHSILVYDDLSIYDCSTIIGYCD